MCVWYSLRNIEYLISEFFIDSNKSINYVAFRRKIVLNTFIVFHKLIFGLAQAIFVIMAQWQMHSLIIYDDSDGLAF